jgi:multidrug efflux system membrane fusion protein
MAVNEDSQKAPASVQTAGHKGFPWVAVVIGVVAIAGIVWLVQYRRSHSAAAGGPGGRGAGGMGGSNTIPIAAIIGTVTQKDFAIFLDGLGTVQALNTVTVRSRVDGQLQKLSFDEGQEVHAGDVLAQIDPAPFRTQVQQAEAKKAQDEAQLANARIDLKRNEQLLASKIVSQEVYDSAKALVSQLQAAVNADQAAVDSAKVQLNYSTVTAPIDGRTGIRLVDAGNIIRAGDSNGLVVLTQVHPISLVFTLPEQSLGQIQSHEAEAQMSVLALDRDNSTVLDEGKLAVIDNQIDTSTGTIRLKAIFPNTKLKLWPGQFVNARLLLSVRTNGIVVPASVVQRGPEGSYAFVVGEDSRVKMAQVKVARIDQGQALIDSGLEAGQRVVVDGQYKLQPGSLVKPAEAPGAVARATTNATPAGKSGRKKDPQGAQARSK